MSTEREERIATGDPAEPAVKRGLGPELARAAPGRKIGLLFAAAALGALAWLGFSIDDGWRFETGLKQVRALMDADHFGDALIWLRARPARWADEPEICYRRGVCEHAAGNIDAALDAWSRVDPRSPWGARAGLARAQTLVGDRGRFHEAETLLESLMRLPTGEREPIRHALAELYFWEGRRGDVRRLLEEGFQTAADPKLDLRDHWRVDGAVTLLEKVRSEVEHAAHAAPDDDRVWLAQAAIAEQTGRLDEARRWLDRCLERASDDPVVWRAFLGWARLAGDQGLVERAAAHIPARLLTPVDQLALRAWIQEKRGDPRAERETLLELIRLVPESWALERLAVLEGRLGDASKAREYRNRKAEVDHARDRYRLLIEEPITPSRFVELAQLAETQGRTFEARGFWTLAARSNPSDRSIRGRIARLATTPKSELNAQVTLAQALGLSTVDADNRARLVDSQPRPGERLPFFRDRAQEAGLRFVYDNGRSPQRQLPETTGGGVALLDYDGDGWLDVFVVQGGVFPPRPDAPNTGDRLFRNKGDGTFEDATERSGLGATPGGYGLGVAVGDLNNDGRPDLFVTRWRAYALYLNHAGGQFEDATARYGLGGDRGWASSAAFADLDNDGDLDLYVCHYLAWDADHPTLCDRKTHAAVSERVEPDQVYNYCTPRLFQALPDHLFRNDGGRFVDVSKEAGILETEGRGLGVVAADVDGDGKVDLFVANDMTANYLWHNLGGMKFEEAGVVSGVACNADGAFQAGMGAAAGDLDGDGLLDLFVTNFYSESTTFFRNLGSGIFSDQTRAIGLAGPSRFLLGFGIVLFDADGDGWLDLATANGHVNDDRPDYPYQMPALLLRGGPGGRLTDVSQQAGDPWRVARVARGLAAGDLDNDGKVDLVFVSQQSPLAYFHNETKGGRSVAFQLEGVRSNREGTGAVITLEAGGRQRKAWKTGGGSFQSASDPRVFFGLGDDQVERVTVRWPSGQVDVIEGVAVGSCYHLKEGLTKPIAARFR